MNNPKPTSTESQSMRQRQSQAPKRVGQDGNPIERARLAQTRQEKQEQEQGRGARGRGPAQEGGKLAKLLPWIVTGSAVGLGVGSSLMT